MSDDLYDLRYALTVGHFNHVINESQSLKPSSYGKQAEEVKNERDYLVAKAQIGLRRYGLAISDLEGSSWPAHRALVLLAKYLRAGALSQPDASTQQDCVEKVTEMVEQVLKDRGEATVDNCMLATAAASVLIHAGDFKVAHTWLQTWAKSLDAKLSKNKEDSNVKNHLMEVKGLLIDIYLRINRTDKADQELRAMHKVDDEHFVYSMWNVWTHIRKQTASDATEAEKMLSDLSKYGNTPQLLNAKALCHMVRMEWQDALHVLQDATAMREDDPDTLINTMICQRQVRPGSDNANTMEILKGSPGHPWVRNYNRMADRFDEIAMREGSGN